jgi:hypothetical protein
MEPACHWSAETRPRFKTEGHWDGSTALAICRTRAQAGMVVNRALIVPGNLNASANAKLKRLH